MKLLINYSFIFLFISCNLKSKELVGLYVLQKNDIKEELILHKNSSYDRKIFDSNNEDLLLEFSGEWSYEKNEIVFENFYKSFLNAELYKDYLNNEIKDNRLYNTSLQVKKSIFNDVYIEVTDLGKVVAKYRKKSIEH